MKMRESREIDEVLQVSHSCVSVVAMKMSKSKDLAI